jgi:hypothetical protein
LSRRQSGAAFAANATVGWRFKVCAVLIDVSFDLARLLRDRCSGLVFLHGHWKSQRHPLPPIAPVSVRQNRAAASEVTSAHRHQESIMDDVSQP